MKKLLACALFLSACGGPHLGDNYGRRVRAGLDAQKANRGDGMGLDGDDARLVMEQHRAAPGAGGATRTGAAVTPASSIGGGMSASGTVATPITPIRLDAVR
jgi:hypothetical protein